MADASATSGTDHLVLSLWLPGDAHGHDELDVAIRVARLADQACVGQLGDGHTSVGRVAATVTSTRTLRGVWQDRSALSSAPRSRQHEAVE
jgi:hypothetical protein